MSSFLPLFLQDTRVSLRTIRTHLEALAEGQEQRKHTYEVRRLLHSLKGSSRLMGFPDLSTSLAGIEVPWKQLLNESRTVEPKLIEETVRALETIADVVDSLSPAES